MRRNQNRLIIILSTLVAILFVIVLYLLYIVNIPKPAPIVVTPPLPTPTQIPDTPTPVPPTSTVAPTVLPKAKLLNTSTWQTHSCGPISFKAPEGYKVTCTPEWDVVIIKGDQYSTQASINIRSFDGASRRQYWIKTIQARPEDVTKYMRFQETQFGSVIGLDVFASGGWWQGGYASPILIASGKTIVAIHGGRTFDDQANKITRWDFTDTIASTIKFN